MPKTQALPLWATPERRAVLVGLWRLYGNKCLQGHTACSDITHYIHTEAKTVWTNKPVYLPCLDSSGNPIRGKFLTLYKPIKVAGYEASFSRLYDVKTEQVIDNWKAEDRIERTEQDRLESLFLHNLAEPKHPLRGRFSAISRDIWKSSQPLYYIEGVGISSLTFQPFVRVRLSSSYMRLYVNIGKVFRGVSKSKKRKAIRYHKPLPTNIEQAISQLVRLSVLDYLTH